MELVKANFHRRNDLHLTRKLFHISGGFILLFIFLYLAKPKEWMVAFLGIILSGVLATEYARSRWKWVNQISLRLFSSIIRQDEVDRLTGIPFYVASCLFAILIFPKHIAALSILHLALGDPSSSFFGVLFGKDKLFPNKSLQGTMGGFCMCALVSFLYFMHMEVDPEKRVLLALIGGFSGAMAEMLPLNVDDNFSIPVVSGAFMWLTFWCANLPMS